MSYPLAILTPRIGTRSETFIRRYIENLVPGGTVAVTDTVDAPQGGHWNVDCPVLAMNQVLNVRFRRRVLWAVAGKLGYRVGDRLAVGKRFLRKHQVRVVMSQYLDWSLPWLDVARELRIPFVGHAHGFDISSRLRDPAWRDSYARYDEVAAVITMSHAGREKLLELGLNAQKVHVIPYGVDVLPRPLMRTEDGTVRCVAVGRMTAKKAPILTLDAFRRAAEARPNLRLDYVGMGELLPAAQQFVRAFGLGDRITLHGGQPNEVVQELLRKADIYLQHSITDPNTGDEEGLPVAILEAMASSLPVVATRHAGIPEAVQHISTGYLVEEGDTAAMAECLVTLADDADLRCRMGEAAWRRARDQFSWKRERAHLLRILGLPEQVPENRFLSPTTKH